ncbi:MAG: 6-carboxytetrahydropterin synthase QueD [Phycisphaerales bacterium]|nr:6-carboxytetrahydropterin synthase QueD [Phycisphaerales bacterium]
MHVKLIKQFRFEAAHDLPTFPPGHKCRRLHGHSYRFDVVIEGEVDSGKGYLADYGEITSACAPLIQQLDHYYLNDISGLENPTSEVLAKWIYDRVKPVLPLLVRIVVYETCTSSCEYAG